jgi:DNA/RNA endonuclease G (NUC1)
MNYQGAVWQEIFLECHYTNAAPQRSLLNQGKQPWQGLENYILDSARMHGLKACIVTAPCTLTKIRYLRGERSRTTGVLEDDGHGG